MHTSKNAAIALALLSTAVTSGIAHERPFALMAGDLAPKLAVSKWVKGEPVKEFEPGKTYVVEFWATWCGPCKQSIPHLTEMQQKYKNVDFIGVSVWENQPDGVVPFVHQMGGKMAYRVAMDKLPAGANPNTGLMAKTWMTAAGQDGIPTAFIVKNRHVVWIGHPMTIDEPLHQIASGTFNADAYAKHYVQEKTEEAELKPIQQRLAMSFQQKDWAGFNSAVKQAYDGPLHNNPDLINNLAWSMVAPASPIQKPDLALLRKMMEHATELESRKNFATLDTLARIYHLLGNNSKAAETEKTAISVAPADQKGGLRTVLADYVKG